MATMEKACEGCSVVFSARCRRDGIPQRFCSRVCQKLNWPTKVQITCEWCKRTFLYDRRTAHSDRRAFRRFCSHACKIEHWRANGKPGPKGQSRRITQAGYVDVPAPDHPAVQGKPYKRVYEHRLVMEKFLGRYLYPWENVHHKDGNRQHNELANLELWVRPQPCGIRLADVVSTYEAEVTALRQRILALESQLQT